MISQLISDLAMHSKARKKIRRRLCAYLRKHKEYFSFTDNGRIYRKIEGRYLGDLSDAALIEYTTMIRRRLNNET